MAVRFDALERLQSDLIAVLEKLERERLGRVEAERQVAVLAARQNDLQERLAEMKHEVERANTQVEKVRGQVDSLTERMPTAGKTSRAATASHRLPPRVGARAAIEERPASDDDVRERQ